MQPICSPECSTCQYASEYAVLQEQNIDSIELESFKVWGVQIQSRDRNSGVWMILKLIIPGMIHYSKCPSPLKVMSKDRPD